MLLREVGAHRYVADPSTQVLCCAFALGDGPIMLWKPGDAVPAEFHEAADNPDAIIVAHNDAFESAVEVHILAPQYGWPLVPLERHRCTMAAGLALSLPAKLEQIARVLELRNQKDAAGHRLMLQMSKPRKARNPRTGETVMVPARKSVTFKAGREMLTRVAKLGTEEQPAAAAEKGTKSQA